MKNLACFLGFICSIIFSFQNVSACSCYINPPLCTEYAQNEAVFIGKVTEIKGPDENFVLKIKVEVIKNFKGVESKTVWTTVGETSCDYEDFKVGKTFLIYGNLSKTDKTYFGTSYCSRTREYKEDLSDLEFLNSVNESKPFYLISGKIFKNYFEPITGVKAEITNKRKKKIVTSDKNGDFNIWLSGEGKYKVKVFTPKETIFDFDSVPRLNFILTQYNEILKNVDFKGTSTFVDFEIEVKANNCGWFYLPLQKYREDKEELDETDNN